MKTIIIFIKSMSAAGGIERVIANLVDNWRNKYRIVLLVKDVEKKSFYSLPEEITYISLNEPLKLNMRNRIQRIFSVFVNFCKCHFKLKEILKNTEFDYIYTTTSLNALEVFLAHPAYRNKMVVSEHASAFAVNGVYQIIKRFVYPKAYCVSVPNKMDCEIYKSWGCNTIYIPHLVTFKAINKNALDTKIALNIGRYTADKRQKELIEIWSSIPRKNGWKLWIVGSGEEEDNLRETISRLKVEDSVNLIPHTSNIKEIYKQASLFVFTSRMEGFGMVLLEAMAFGIPCLSYDCPSGPRDVIEDGKNGRLIKNGDMNEFESAFQEFMCYSNDILRQYGNKAFETVLKWDNHEILKRWDRVFNKS